MIGRACALCLGLAIGVTLQAQSSEVASVRLTKPDSGTTHHLECNDGGRFVFAGLPLNAAIQWAYDVRFFQMSGGPGWMKSPEDLYDIEAKAAGQTSQAQCKAMVQRLLADRFDLRVRWDTKQVSAYVLLVGKRGARLHEVKPDDPTGPGVKINGVPQNAPPGQPWTSGWIAKGWSMAQLAGFLTGKCALDERPVVDRTGLKGIYQFNLDFSDCNGNEEAELFTVLADQLGLRVESRKEAVKMLVVEHIERPSAN